MDADKDTALAYTGLVASSNDPSAKRPEIEEKVRKYNKMNSCSI